MLTVKPEDLFRLALAEWIDKRGHWYPYEIAFRNALREEASRIRQEMLQGRQFQGQYLTISNVEWARALQVLGGQYARSHYPQKPRRNEAEDAD